MSRKFCIIQETKSYLMKETDCSETGRVPRSICG